MTTSRPLLIPVIRGLKGQWLIYMPSGLRYWMGEMAKWASTGLQRHFVKEVVLPHFYFFAPQVYFSEVLIAVTLILGLFSRLGAFIGTLMAINLWLGLYRSPAERPWTYFFLIIVKIMLL